MSTSTIHAGSEAGGSVFSAFLPFLFATIAIFVVLFLVYWFLKSPGRSRGKGQFFEVVASQPLDRYSNIHLVRYLGKFLVTLTTSGSVSVVEIIDDETTVEQLQIRFSSRKTSPFMAAFNKKVFEDQIKRMDRLS
ncbi:MAG TPA: flagellar biosynthetic protein FliO [Thermotogota bacterium]|nr:flagellar biosynthetic protein FliO [Thermotogota bacterium]HRW92694.1 flagellar biosynthetic protein FliO [Thermotogota bacterium]